MTRRPQPQIQTKTLKDIAKMDMPIRARLNSANESGRLSAIPNFEGSNIFPRKVGEATLSLMAKEVFKGAGVIKTEEEDRLIAPVLGDLNSYFDRHGEKQTDKLSGEERTELAGFVGGSILESLEGARRIVTDFHGPGIYEGRLATLQQYIGLVVREQAFGDQGQGQVARPRIPA